MRCWLARVKSAIIRYTDELLLEYDHRAANELRNRVQSAVEFFASQIDDGVNFEVSTPSSDVAEELSDGEEEGEIRPVDSKRNEMLAETARRGAAVCRLERLPEPLLGVWGRPVLFAVNFLADEASPTSVPNRRSVLRIFSLTLYGWPRRAEQAAKNVAQA